MKKLIWVVVALLALVCSCKKDSAKRADEQLCNGHNALCGKKYNEVAYLGAHNAFNYKGPFAFPNQNISITKQLQMGVRCFMIDIYLEGDKILVHHGVKALGYQTGEQVFGEVLNFMIDNPNEIVTLILQNQEVSTPKIALLYEDLGLDVFGYTHNETAGWPYLTDMIAQNKRLVTFVENDDSDIDNYPYILDGYTYMFENEYEHTQLSDFNCDEKRGSGGKREIYLLNHWIGLLGDENGAKKVNKFDFLANQVKNCTEEKDHMVNFVALDFVDIGDGLAVVDSINGVN